MISYSEEYSKKMFDFSQTHRLRGTLDGIVFNQDDIKDLRVNSQASGQNVLIGSAAISKLTFTLLNPLLPRYSYEDREITIQDGTVLEDGSVEYVEIGTFWIGEANWTNVGTVQITAYDCLSKLDKDIAVSQTSGTIWDFMQIIQLETGARCGMSQAECSALPNGTETVSPYEQNQLKTYRDMLAKLAQLAGGFAYAKRDGTFAIKNFAVNSSLTIPLLRRKNDAIYSDFVTRYDYMSYIDTNTGGTVYVGDMNGSGMDIGENPFIQYGLEETRTRMVNTIFSEVQKMQFTPSKVTVLPSFAVLELGDTVVYTDDYTGNDSKSTIMSWSYAYGRSVTFQCYGANPNLKNGKSSTDNELNRILAKTAENENIIHTYMNAQAFTLGDDSIVSIVKIRFATVKPRTVKFHAEIDLDTQTTASSGVIRCQAFYYLNGELLTHSPITTWNNSGFHILPLMYFFKDLPSGASYELEVRLRMTGGTATIDRENAIAYLEGQGLVALNKFDGSIEIEDEYTPIRLHRSITPLAEGVEINTQQPRRIYVAETYTALKAHRAIVAMAESVRLVATPVQYTRVLEDEETIRTTEDGSIRLTEV